MIDSIEIGSISNNYYNEYGNNMLYLSNLKHINIFVGENNSGKSRLLRYLVNGNDTKAFAEIKNGGIKDNYNAQKITLIRYVERFNKDSNITINIDDELNYLSDSNYYIAVREYLDGLNIDLKSLNPNQKSLYNSIEECLNHMYQYVSKNNNSISSKKVTDYDVTYIPILRGIECFDTYYHLKNESVMNSISLDQSQRETLNEYKNISKRIYSNKIFQVYNIPDKKVFTAENLFDEVKEKLLGREEGRTQIKEFEEFISREFYNNEGFTIIPQINDGYLNVKIGNSPERALHDLGDGIKQLISLLYKIFEKRNTNAIFFIEEPELNLHPGYQRKFIQLLQNNELFSKQQFFITTHSNHLIDSCLNFEDISIYKFVNIDNSNKKFKVINTTNKDVEILDLLGVNNTSVFMSNCTIWVEGISDKILISKYLDIYLNEKAKGMYKEDINYSFVEYGGNNIEHWNFLDTNDISKIKASTITNRCFVICDNDDEKKASRKNRLRRIFNDCFYELKVREIENTISRKVLEKTLFDNNPPLLKKEYNGEAYANSKTYMGSYIDEHYCLSKQYSSKSNKSGNGTGTIRDKISFAKAVASNITSLDDLSEGAKDLCKKIYKFIEKSNNIKKDN